MTSKQFSATFEQNPAAKSDDQREAILADPGFGKLFTDHMFLAEWTPDTGWANARVVPYGPLSLDPATAVLHYAQEIFEGLKAYVHADGSVWMFRPEANGERMQRSAHRLALPELPIDWFIGSIEALIEADRAWVPAGGEKSLYIRPFMFASEAFLGVRPSQHVTYSVIASPAGAYFAGGVKAVSIWLSTTYSRAGAGGTGAAKTGGNYASSLLPQQEAIEQGCAQVAFLDSVEHKWVEELGGMNLYFVHSDGSIVTPTLSGSILEGVTRDSILTLAARPRLRGHRASGQHRRVARRRRRRHDHRGLRLRHGRGRHTDRLAQVGRRRGCHRRRRGRQGHVRHPGRPGRHPVRSRSRPSRLDAQVLLRSTQ